MNKLIPTCFQVKKLNFKFDFKKKILTKLSRL